ncbi:MAG: site-2 protease family protein [Myxococcota bacterium]
MNTLLAGGVLLGVLVFVHELGHFLVAKASGVRVLTFSLGFGPRLFGFRRGETDYRVSIIPLGGYVRMYGDDITEEVPEEERDKSFLHKPTLQKSAIAFAGPAANFLLPVLLFFAVFFGTETVHTALVGTVVPGEPAAQAGLREGDRIVQIGDAPVETFPEVQSLIESSPDTPLRVVIERGTERLSLQVTPKGTPSLNPLEKGERVGRVGIMPHVQQPFVTVAPGSPAAAAGVLTLDRIEAVDGEPVRTQEELLARLDAAREGTLSLSIVVQPLTAAKEGREPERRTVTFERRSDERPAAYILDEGVEKYAVTEDELAAPTTAKLVATTRSALEGAAAAVAARGGLSSYEGTLQLVREDTPAHQLGVKAGDLAAIVDGMPVHVGSEVSVRLLGAPDDVHVIGLLGQDGRARVVVFRLEAEKERGREDFKTFGAFPGGGTYSDGETIERSVGVTEALSRAVGETFELIGMTAKSLWMLATLQVSMSSLGGPITIVDLAGQAAERGAKSFVMLMAFISVNLGLVNLLPVPVLDGGHLLMFGIEAVTRQRISAATRERAVKVGFALLMCLVVVSLFNDVLRLL